MERVLSQYWEQKQTYTHTSTHAHTYSHTWTRGRSHKAVEEPVVKQKVWNGVKNRGKLSVATGTKASESKSKRITSQPLNCSLPNILTFLIPLPIHYIHLANHQGLNQSKCLPCLLLLQDCLAVLAENIQSCRWSVIDPWSWLPLGFAVVGNPFSPYWSLSSIVHRGSLSNLGLHYHPQTSSFVRYHRKREATRQ